MVKAMETADQDAESSGTAGTCNSKITNVTLEVHKVSSPPKGAERVQLHVNIVSGIEKSMNSRIPSATTVGSWGTYTEHFLEQENQCSREVSVTHYPPHPGGGRKARDTQPIICFKDRASPIMVTVEVEDMQSQWIGHRSCMFTGVRGRELRAKKTFSASNILLYGCTLETQSNS